MNIWGTRIALIHVAIQGPIVAYPKIVEPWRVLLKCAKIKDDIQKPITMFSAMVGV